MKIGEAINKLNEIEKKFSKYDIELRDWIMNYNELLESCLELISSQLNIDKITKHVLKKGNAKPKDIATVIVHELKQFAGHTLNFTNKKPTYPEILCDVHKRLCKDKKIDFIDGMTIDQREDEITRIILKISLEGLSEEEIKEIMSGMGLDYSKEKRKEIISSTIAGGSILALTKILGKKTIKEFILKTLETYIAKKVGKKIITGVFEKLAKKLPQYFFKGLGNVIGGVFIAYDIYQIGGEATRVTTPLVLEIAIYKSLSRINSENLKESA